MKDDYTTNFHYSLIQFLWLGECGWEWNGQTSRSVSSLCRHSQVGSLVMHWLFSIPMPDIDDCASNPCQNGGTCVDGVNRYTCSCSAEFSSDNCAKNSKTEYPSILYEHVASLAFNKDSLPHPLRRDASNSYRVCNSIKKPAIPQSGVELELVFFMY